MAKDSVKKENKLDINKILIGAVLVFSLVAMGIRYLNADRGKYAMVAIDNTATRYEISLEEEKILHHSLILGIHLGNNKRSKVFKEDALSLFTFRPLNTSPFNNWMPLVNLGLHSMTK